MMTNKKTQENYEKEVAELFLNLFNEDHGTDYKVGPVEEQRSSIDRRGISKSGKFEELKLQLKRVRKWDAKTVEQLRVSKAKKGGKYVKVFDSDVFRLLSPTLKKALRKYKNNPEINDLLLVLEVSVAKAWLEEWKRTAEENFSSYPFKGIYCVAKPSEGHDAYIFPIKKIKT